MKEVQKNNLREVFDDFDIQQSNRFSKAALRTLESFG